MPAPQAPPDVTGSGPRPKIVTGADPELVGPLLARTLHDPSWLHCEVELLSGGMSNLTYRVRSPGGDLILRRPPLGHILPTAHDMGREYRVLTALAGTRVPVPRTLLLVGGSGESSGKSGGSGGSGESGESGESSGKSGGSGGSGGSGMSGESVTNSPLGAPFYVMERSMGHICRNGFPDGYADTPADRAAIGEALVDVLAALHTTDPNQIGLADFGRPTGFTERQVRRWTEQWRRTKTEELPALDELADRLGNTLPPQGPGAIVHGDYRLDNVVLHPARPGEIVAVLDWEMSTLGDPLMDLGALMSYWSDPDDDEVLQRARVVPPVTAAPGFPSRAEVMARYADKTGFDVTHVNWYQAFASFKVAVIIQGIAARLAEGAMLDQDLDVPDGLVEALIEAGLRQLALAP